MNDRQSALSKAYSRANQELRKNHQEEFHSILQEIYAEMGITVRKRLTGERKRLAEIEKHRAALEALESDSE